LVDIDNFFGILESKKYDIFYENGDLESSTADVWKELSFAKKKNAYQYIFRYISQ